MCDGKPQPQINFPQPWNLCYSFGLEMPLQRIDPMDILAQYSTIAIAIAILLALLIGTLVILKMFQRRVRGRRGQRLGISEFQEIDESRRLVIIRRDNVEHLLLIGGENDLVVESNIGRRGASLRDDADDETSGERLEPSAPMAAIPLRPPRAPVFGDRRPQLRSVDPPIAVSPRKFDEDK
jgi:Flagellar biosynthesis protein, FliO